MNELERLEEILRLKKELAAVEDKRTELNNKIMVLEIVGEIRSTALASLE